jgi:biopolymer transport protein TolR
MGMTGTAGNAVGRRRHRRHGVMADINVTPMVDVMLVLLIIFMVSAPLLTVGVPIDLPQTKAKNISTDQEPLTVSLDDKAQVFLQSSKEPLSYDELVAKLKAISQQRGGGFEERIFVRGDRKLDYGSVMKVMALLTAAGFRKVGLVTEVEQGH